MFLLSLPMRGRGLKYAQGNDKDDEVLSLPMRGRGLKYERDARGGTRYTSLPMRGRGLKLVHLLAEATKTSGRSPCGGVD